MLGVQCGGHLGTSYMWPTSIEQEGKSCAIMVMPSVILSVMRGKTWYCMLLDSIYSKMGKSWDYTISSTGVGLKFCLSQFWRLKSLMFIFISHKGNMYPVI